MDIIFRRKFNEPAKTFNEAELSVWVVATTEDIIYNWYPRRMEFINIVNLMSGFVYPEGNRVPVLNSHNRKGVENVLGTATDFTVEGNQLMCRICFSQNSGLARETALKIRDGHITDVSVAVVDIETDYIKPQKIKMVEGTLYEGPMVVVTKWRLYELSVCPFGANPYAKVRNEGEQINPYFVSDLACMLLDASVIAFEEKGQMQKRDAGILHGERKEPVKDEQKKGKDGKPKKTTNSDVQGENMPVENQKVNTVQAEAVHFRITPFSLVLIVFIAFVIFLVFQMDLF